MAHRDTALSMVESIMLDFAGRTGLWPVGKAPRRYLWTDAFAVCNFLELYRQKNDPKYRQLALNLVDQVHNVLGRHRTDDTRTGWISGLGEEEGKKHPTRGGLRIGKAMNERKPSEPYDDRREWDQDGQYYHYLTKWMHALHQVSRATGCAAFNQWAVELAKTAHDRFTCAMPAGGRRRMVWKMSIDLSYPLVPSMGQHDPLDGYITYLRLQATATDFNKGDQPVLYSEIADMASLCKGQNWATGDPLGIGGLLGDAFRVGQLILRENIDELKLLETLIDALLPSMETFAVRNPFRLPADHRLAFRELGLCIGLEAMDKLRQMLSENPDRFGEQRFLASQVQSLGQYESFAKIIENFWLAHDHRQVAAWIAHQDINAVMLATSLAPDGYLIYR
jgi:hypothetical protein